MCLSSTRPAFIPVPDVARLEVIYSYLGETCENVLHFKQTGPWSADSLAALCTAALVNWAADIGSVTTNQVLLEKVKAVALDGPDGFGVEEEATTVITGGRTAAGLPGNVTLATKFSAGFIGRSQRGRAYLVGVPKDEQSGDRVADAYAVDVRDAWQAFCSHIGAGTASQHVVVSYCHNGAWRTTGQATVITQYSTEHNLDSMRRRLTGRGA